MLFFGSSLTPTLAAGILIAVLIGMTVHEFAHNYVAHLMGDPVPAREGRLTLDPSVHIYWPGFIMFVLIGFGILGTAPISPGRMRNPRWGYLAAVAAGPFSNLLLAAIFGVIFRIANDLLGVEVGAINDILIMIVFFNALLFVFNLIPLFPLDGWHMTLALLPPEQANWWNDNAQTSQYIFLRLILLSFFPLPGFPDPLSLLIGDPTFAITDWLLS